MMKLVRPRLPALSLSGLAPDGRPDLQPIGDQRQGLRLRYRPQPGEVSFIDAMMDATMDERPETASGFDWHYLIIAGGIALCLWALAALHVAGAG